MSSNWQTLAASEAQALGCDLDIVLATVEAETGGNNTMGDSGNAFGYGQVWYKHWKAAFDYAARRTKLTYPTDIPSLTAFVLANNQFSMAIAVYVINHLWTKNNKNWNLFTHSYVGQGIPDSDYNRREKIWFKYHDGNINSTITTGYSTTYSNNTSASLPQETFQVVPGSINKTGNILYGRRYRILIVDGNNIAFDVSRLRCTFNIVRNVLLEPNYSDVTIYNLNPQTENSIIKEGMRIIVEAGYQGDQYGIIFDGDVLQPIREKEEGTTYKLTITSMDGDKFMNFGLANFSLLRGQSMREVVDNVTNKSTITSELGSISSDLSQSKLTRGKVVFGLSRDVLRQVAQSNAATFYMDNGKVNIIKPADLPKGEVVELSPKSGLIGTPTQTNYGAIIKCLINPQIQLNGLVHIDNSLIRAKEVAIGDFQNPLDQDGLYRVNQIKYIGDTRGDDWYMEMDCISQAGKIPSMLIDPNKQNIY